MGRKVIIFDFDGVIADSSEAIILAIKKIAGLSFSREDRKLGQKSEDYFRSISSDELYFKLPKWKLLLAVLYVRYSLGKDMAKLKPIEGMKEELDKLKEAGYFMGIASSNSLGNIEKFLKTNKLEYFEFIDTGSVFLKKEKRLEKIMKKNNFNEENVIFVGDETRDIEAAKKNGLKTIGVGWGLTFPEVLGKHNPSYIANKPEELFNIINQLYGK